MMRTPAWRSLSPVARAVYLEIEFAYNGSNNGAIRLGCREVAELCGINKDTAARAFRELENLGFIVRNKPGGFYPQRHVTEWRLTARPTIDALPTKDFAKWAPRGSLEPRASGYAQKPVRE